MNVSKESLPNETSILHTKNSRNIHNEANVPDKGNDPNENDDFSDIVDYLLLDTNERGKIERQHLVIDISENHAKSKNPTLGQLKNIKAE